MSALRSVYRIGNILARNNSKKPRGRLFQPLPNFCHVPQPRLIFELVRPNSHCELSCVDADLFGRAGRMRPSAEVDDFTQVSGSLAVLRIWRVGKFSLFPFDRCLMGTRFTGSFCDKPPHSPPELRGLRHGQPPCRARS